MYSCYGITFDSTCLWTFDNDTARNVIILGVDNSSSFHAEKLENKFLALGEGATFGINGGFGPLEKKVIAFIAFHDLHFFFDIPFHTSTSFFNYRLVQFRVRHHR